MAASNPVHASSTSMWGSAAILGGLPKISSRSGDDALEGPGSVEVAPLSPLSEGVALALVGAAGAAGGASGVPMVLAIVGAAGAAPVVSGVPPALGGSVVPGAGVAPVVDGASADVRSSSSPVSPVWQWTPGQGPAWSGWCSSSSSSSSPLSSSRHPWEGEKGRELGQKVSQEQGFLQEYSQGVALHPPPLGREC
jgi:hypothetical protein